jgi:poly(hydroxyalkanoate) depolymerase family esterase
MIRRLILGGCGVAVAIGALAVAIGAPDPPAARHDLASAPRGTVQKRSYPNGYRAVVYTPSSVNRSRPAPLVVMMHGCGTTAEQMEAATELDKQAERYHFVVMYPDASQPRGRCWRFGRDYERSSPDASAIAGMVRNAISRRGQAIDPTRVYVVGMSSGAAMTAVLGATYPDVFAAIAINAGCAYRANHCGGQTPSRPSEDLAREALDAMGDHRRVVPVLIAAGDKDNTVPGHSQQVLDQWRMTDNLVATGTTDGPIAAAPARTREVRGSGRYRSTVEQFDAAPGCEVIERWTIHGMGHFWPGGSTDPDLAPFTDPRGPDGEDVIWSFFRRFRMTPGPDPCARPAQPAASRADP